jgi:hypothetical protein
MHPPHLGRNGRHPGKPVLNAGPKSGVVLRDPRAVCFPRLLSLRQALKNKQKSKRFTQPMGESAAIIAENT